MLRMQPQIFDIHCSQLGKIDLIAPLFFFSTTRERKLRKRIVCALINSVA